jgi:hypothetical protein
VKKVLAHYESQSEEEAVAEDEAAYEESLSVLPFCPWQNILFSRLDKVAM